MTEIVVKRKGHKEVYDDRKVYASVYAACLAAQEPEEVAEKCASTVASHLTRWVGGRKKLTSNDIFRQVIIELSKHSYKSAFMYETHRDLS